MLLLLFNTTLMDPGPPSTGVAIAMDGGMADANFVQLHLSTRDFDRFPDTLTTQGLSLWSLKIVAPVLPPPDVHAAHAEGPAVNCFETNSVNTRPSVSVP